VVCSDASAGDLQRDPAPFRPVWWARGGLRQTLAGAWVGSGTGPALGLERWTTPDGDFVRVHFGPAVPGAPYVLALHGLEGSVRSPYMATLAAAVVAAGWNFVALEFRSCGGEPNRRLRSYHSGETGDLAFCVTRLLQERAVARLGLVGCSLGANVLLKWLGEQGERLPPAVVAAVAISAPFDLARCADACDRRHGGLFARYFLRTLIPKALAKAARFPGTLDPAAVRRCRTFRAFDDLVTGPLHGFRDAEHYWTTQSSGRFLPAVRRPTLLLSAADDPLVPAQTWPRGAIAASKFLQGEQLPVGGHAAFLTGDGRFRARRWAEPEALRWLAAQFAAR
jgi:predicted alpha/beta-fold hydrolase